MPATKVAKLNTPVHDTEGVLSHGRCSHFHAALCISVVILHTKQTGRHEDDFTAHG
jgi:hypothetical protein